MVDRLTDELWTSYLARYLEVEGVPLSDYDHDFPTTSYSSTKNQALTLERTVDLGKMKNPLSYRMIPLHDCVWKNEFLLIFCLNLRMSIFLK